MPAMAQAVRAAIRSGPMPVIRSHMPKDMAKWTRGEKIIAFIEEYCRQPEGPKVGQPIRLLPFQKHFIRAVYDNKAGTSRAILSVARKNGKAKRLDEPVPTPRGWTTMGELKVGDEVFGVDGAPCRVTWVSPVRVPPKAYRLRFDDGAEIEACADHQWETTHKWRPWDVVSKGPRKGEPGVNGRRVRRVVTTEQIAQSLFAPRTDGKVEHNHSIPMAGAVRFRHRRLPLDPYTLGAWLGDGAAGGATLSICHGDEAIAEEIGRRGVPVRRSEANGRGCSTWAMTDGVRDRTKDCALKTLRRLGVLGAKRIPPRYLTASVSQRRDLLRGILDTDGHAARATGSRIEICQRNAGLADDIAHLIRSLGFKVETGTKEVQLAGWDEPRTYVRMAFTAYREDGVFLLRRKNDVLLPRPASPRRSRSRQIVACDPVEPSPMRCIAVDGPRNLYLAGRDFIVTHNTALTAALLLAHVCGPEARRNSQIVSGAQSRDQAALVYSLAEKMIGLNPVLAELCRAVPSRKQIFGLALNVEYRALSADGTTAHGLSPILAILDEVGQVNGPSSPFVDAITTSQGAHDDPLLIAISTQAKSDADMLSVWLDDAERSNDPGVVAHCYEAEENADLLDRRQWKRANPAMRIYRSEKDLRRQLQQAKRLPSAEASARNLLLNQRVALEAMFLAPGVWKANGGAPDTDAFTDFPVAMALDLSAVNDLTAAVLAARDGKGVVHLMPFVFTPSTGIEERAARDRAPYTTWVRKGQMIAIGGRSMDYAQVCEWLHQRLTDLGIEPVVVCFDRWNMRFLRPVAQEIGLAASARWEEVGQGFRDMTPRLRSFETAMLEGKVRHGGHPLLNMAAANAIAVRDAADGRKLDKSKATQRIDPLVAAVMAAHEVLEGEKPVAFDVEAWVG